jgi:uncharacterized protein with PQ loop repeat
MIIELLGWLGGILLSLCAIPQVYKTYKEKNAKGLAWGMLYLWFLGEGCTLVYILFTNIEVGIYQWPLIINYVINLFLVLFLLYAKSKD